MGGIMGLCAEKTPGRAVGSSRMLNGLAVGSGRGGRRAAGSPL